MVARSELLASLSEVEARKNDVYRQMKAAEIMRIRLQELEQQLMQEQTKSAQIQAYATQMMSDLAFVQAESTACHQNFAVLWQRAKTNLCPRSEYERVQRSFRDLDERLLAAETEHRDQLTRLQAQLVVKSRENDALMVSSQVRSMTRLLPGLKSLTTCVAAIIFPNHYVGRTVGKNH